MIQYPDQGTERLRARLTTLSTVGAAVAGAGIGTVLAPTLTPVVWWIIVLGVTSHLLGMVGVRRLLSSAGYRPPLWQHMAYWLCWAGIGIIAVYAAVEAFA